MTRAKPNFGPAVTNPGTPAARLRYASPSAIEKFDEESYGGCELRWAFVYCAGKKEPFKTEQKTGTDMHDTIEHYLKTGENVLSPLAMAGRRFIPDPGDDLLVEHEIATVVNGEIRSELVTRSGVPVVGYIDLVSPRVALDDDGDEISTDPKGTVEIEDWKSTGSKVRYSEANPRKVGDSVQMNTYGAWVARWYSSRGLPPPEYLRLSHGYFLTSSPPRARKVTLRVRAQDVARRWERIEGLVERMAEVAKLPLGQVRGNKAACGAYRGCPHLNYCPVGREQNADEVFGAGDAPDLTDLLGPRMAAALLGEEEKTMSDSLLDDLDLPEEPAVELSVADAMEELLATEKAMTREPPKPLYPPGFPEWVAIIDGARAGGDPVGFPRCTGAAEVALASLFGAGAGHDKAKGTGRLGAKLAEDPDTIRAMAEQLKAAAEKGQITIVTAASKPAPAKPAALEPEDAPAPTKPAPAPAPEASAEAAIAAAADAATKKRGPGRPPKAKSTGATAATSPAVESAAPPAPASSPTPAGVTLYVDSIPSTPYTLLDPWVRALAETVADEYQAVDVRMPPSKDSPIAYGAWRGVVAALARKKGAELPAGQYVLLRRSEIDEVVADALRAVAANHVMAVPR